MAHLKATADRFSATPKEWLKFGGQVGEQCNTWAARGDIVAYVGKGAGQGVAVACFVPSIAEMELNVVQAFGDGIEPQWLGNFTDRETHFDHPPIAGCVLHEAMHARHTLYDLTIWQRVYKEDGRFVQKTMENFEETRIESRGIKHYPENRSFLRASALKLSLNELKDEEDFDKRGIESLSQLILLSLARVDAGVLDEDDVLPVQRVAEKVLGAPLLEQLREIWWKAQQHDDDRDAEPLLVLAREWVEKLKEAGFEPPPDPKVTVVVVSGSGSPDGDEGDGGPAPDGSVIVISEEQLQDLMDEMEEQAGETEIDARTEAAGQSQKESDERAAQAGKELAEESKDAVEQSSKVFGRGTTDARGTTRSRLAEEREPKAAEKIAAVKIAKQLDKARYRDRVVTPTRSVLPPGKLSGRAAIQAHVERSRGQMQKAEPWKSKQRRHVEDPTLKLGLMTDVSGSMNQAMEPMAVTGWLMSEAGRRIQAQVASVYYGTSVFAGVAPGQYQEKIKVYGAHDMTERFDAAFRALNGKLGLLDGTGARLLVIASDMCYTAGEVEALQKWLRRCKQSGVAVVSLPYTTSNYVENYTKGLNVHVVEGAMKPAEAAEYIGKACADALTKAGSRA